MGKLGKLIVLEGVDGAGKTTQAKALGDFLTARGEVVHLTAEPSRGLVGQLLRRSLTGQEPGLNGDIMALLFAADRLDHLAREILPELMAGHHVITDRYYHSSFAYQGQESDLSWVQQLNQRARR